MDFLREYNKPYEKRILLQLIIALLLSAIIGFESPIKMLLALLGIFFLLDMILTRLDKIIRLKEVE